MNETTTKSKKPTKICLKCGRGLHSNQEKCSSCGCEDIMNKKEYYELVDKYERADINQKNQIKNNLKYEKFFRYNYVKPQKDIAKNTSKDKWDKDTLYLILAFIFSILSFISLIWGTVYFKSGFIGIILMGICIAIAGAFFNNTSNKTKQETARIIKEQKEQKEYQELHGGYKCPNCGEHAGHEINTMKKAISVGTLGLASNKIGKNYECKNCGYKW